MDKQLLWVDIETTGLDPNEDVLLEVGFRVTNLALETLAEQSWLVWVDTWNRIVPDNVDKFVLDMHAKSGLLRECGKGRIPEVVEAEIVTWLKDHNVTTADPLCGSSVHFDRLWLGLWMPEVIECVGYRNIDVSTLKEICKRYNESLASVLDEATRPKKLHRVLPDIEDTIGEYRFYLESFLHIDIDVVF